MGYAEQTAPTRGGGSPWHMKERWEGGSDHAIVAAKVEGGAKSIMTKGIKWEAVRQSVEEPE